MRRDNHDWMNKFRRRLRRVLTLRLRLTLWFIVLLAITSIGFVLAVNVVATILIPQTVSDIPLQDFVSEENNDPSVAPNSSSLPSIQIPRRDSSLIIDLTLQGVRAISLAVMGFMIILGSVGAYFLAGRALRPISYLSQEVAEIDSGNLGKRLSVEGAVDEVSRLADAFDNALERLDYSFGQQRRFASNAAHELRTPLAALRANLEVILDDPRATLADYQEMVITQEQMLARLERLVSNLLLLTRGEYESVDKGISLLPLLEEVVANLSPQAEKYQVSLRLVAQTESFLNGDDVLISSIFSNLIENGIRYNRPGGSVEVSAWEEPAWIVISVADTGVGIPAEEQSLILEPLYRRPVPSSGHDPGTGLGLSIVVHLVHLYKGRLDIESTVGVGSTFTVRLPKT